MHGVTFQWLVTESNLHLVYQDTLLVTQTLLLLNEEALQLQWQMILSLSDWEGSATDPIVRLYTLCNTMASRLSGEYPLYHNYPIM